MNAQMLTVCFSAANDEDARRIEEEVRKLVAVQVGERGMETELLPDWRSTPTSHPNMPVTLSNNRMRDLPEDY